MCYLPTLCASYFLILLLLYSSTYEQDNGHVEPHTPPSPPHGKSHACCPTCDGCRRLSSCNNGDFNNANDSGEDEYESSDEDDDVDDHDAFCEGCSICYGINWRD